MANVEFSPELIAQYAPLRSSAFSSLFQRDVCVDPHGIEYRCGFSVSKNNEVTQEDGSLHIPIGTRQVVKIPELEHIARKTIIHVRCVDGRILTQDNRSEDLVETNKDIGKFLECWTLFNERTPTLRGCNSNDDEQMPQWVDFRNAMWEIDESVKNAICIWNEFFAEGMFPW